MMKKNYANIVALGGYKPKFARTNSFLEGILDTTEDWIVKRTGIHERKIENDRYATSDMSVFAIQDLQNKYDVELEDVDAVIVATSTPDYKMPSTAHVVCKKMNFKNALAFDLNAACSGFLYALSVGNSFIESGRFKKVLIVGADKMSSLIDINDRNTTVIFGDGAGAALLQPSPKQSFLESLFETDGENQESLMVPSGGSKDPINLTNVLKRNHFLKQEGRVVFKKAVSSITDICRKVLEKNDMSAEDIDWVIPHQANMRIIESVAKNLGIDESKMLSNLKDLGNTASASIILCLSDYHHLFKEGDKILLTSFGSGMAWGATVFEWAKVSPAYEFQEIQNNGLEVSCE